MSNPIFHHESKAFAPVNIAWIKYMGKNGSLPTNSSLSLTLATLGTHTSMKIEGESPVLNFEWNPTGYIPPMMGQKKAEDFLSHESIWSELLTQFGFHYHVPKAKVVITTINNVPAGTGIATSASAFAALTLVWSALLAGNRKQEWIEMYETGDPVFRRALAKVASKGSGSSCRSLDGPWVEWNPDQGISVVDGGLTEWMDFILLIDSDPKLVPSSEAHQRVKTSPEFKDRSERAEKRLLDLKLLLKRDTSISEVKKLVLDEALDMHHLFQTSEPPFKYMSALSEEVISKVQDSPLKAVITLDAGANVHLFVPVNEENITDEWIKSNFPTIKYLKDVTGYGAHYGS